MNIEQHKNYLTEYWRCDDEDSDLESTLVNMLESGKTQTKPITARTLTYTENRNLLNTGISIGEKHKMILKKSSSQTTTGLKGPQIMDSIKDNGSWKNEILGKMKPITSTLERIVDAEQTDAKKMMSNANELNNDYQLPEFNEKEVLNTSFGLNLSSRQNPKKLYTKKSSGFNLMHVTPSTLDDSGTFNSRFPSRRARTDIQLNHSPSMPSASGKAVSDPLVLSSKVREYPERPLLKLKVPAETARLYSSETEPSPIDKKEKLSSREPLLKANFNFNSWNNSDVKEGTPKHQHDILTAMESPNKSPIKLPRLENIKKAIHTRNPSQSSTNSDMSNSSLGSGAVSPRPQFNVGVDTKRKSKFFENHNSEGSVFKIVAIGQLNRPLLS